MPCCHGFPVSFAPVFQGIQPFCTPASAGIAECFVQNFADQTGFMSDICSVLLSPPMRGRGLKSCSCHAPCRNRFVAPYAGAWIEIVCAACAFNAEVMSPPMRGRGLKYPIMAKRHPRLCVAPYAGAWIEIVTVTENVIKGYGSPPMRGRGLKS